MVSRVNTTGMPLGVPVLEDLPDPGGQAVLVRATLDLPLGADGSGPMAARRSSSLAATLRWLVERNAHVTVCGDAGAVDPGEEAARFERVRQVVQALSPDVLVVDSSSGGGLSAEDGAVVEDLVDRHDLFVNDSFQWSYLPLPSLMLPPSRLSSAVGRGVQHDLEVLRPLIDWPGRPFVAVLGRPSVPEAAPLGWLGGAC